VIKPEILLDESHCEQCACGDGLDFSLTFAFQPIVDVTNKTVYAYKEMGFRTAIDDFGAGYSRYNIMMASPPDLLKLDMALIRDIHKEPNKQAVVVGIITMMALLGGKIVAEGVETEEEYFWLRSQGIALYQGYLFARPGFECLPEPYYPA